MLYSNTLTATDDLTIVQTDNGPAVVFGDMIGLAQRAEYTRTLVNSGVFGRTHDRDVLLATNPAMTVDQAMDMANTLLGSGSRAPMVPQVPTVPVYQPAKPSGLTGGQALGAALIGGLAAIITTAVRDDFR